MSGLLHSQMIGDPSLPAVVCLHGFMGSGLDFLTLAEALSQHFFVLLPDLPGHGKSATFRHEEEWTIPFCAKAVAEMIRSYAPVNLLGYSLGGRVALTMALNEPELIRRLVIESALPGIEDATTRQERTLHDDALAKRIQQQPLDVFLQDWYKQALFAGISQHPLFKQLLDRRLENNRAILARALSEMSSGRMPNLWPMLGDIQKPTLLINGARDNKYAAINTRMHKTNPLFTRSEAPGAGHNVHFSQPKWYLKTISEFLQSVS